MKSEMEQKIYQMSQKFKVRCQSGAIQGAEPIILEFLHLFAKVVDELRDLQTGSLRDFLLEQFEAQIRILDDKGSTLLPLPMYNVINGMKKVISKADVDISHVQLREKLSKWMNEFYNSNFESATSLIVGHTLEKIQSLRATTILTFGWSPIIESILLELAANPIHNLHIKVVDGNSEGPGKRLVKSLIKRNVQCTHGSLNCLGNELPHTQLVLLGATAVLSNGNVLTSRGSAAVVNLARSYGVPVLVTVKSYQFIDKVQTVEMLTPTFDTDLLEAIPSEMVTALATDIRILPPSSAPSVLKSKQ